MKAHLKQPLFTLVAGAIVTALYFVSLTQLFEPISIERYYLGTWGFGVYLFLFSLIGFLFSFKTVKSSSLLCSIGIPALFVLAIFIFLAARPDIIRIPIFDQYREYNESIRYAALSVLVFPSSCATVFSLAYFAFSIKRWYVDRRSRTMNPPLHGGV